MPHPYKLILDFHLKKLIYRFPLQHFQREEFHYYLICL